MRLLLSATGRRAWLRDRRGSLAAFVAIMALPLMIGVAIAVDYSAASSVKSALQAASDAAAMTAVNTAANTFATDPTLVQAQADAKNRFLAQAGSLTNVPGGAPPPTVTVAYNGTSFSATVQYTATYNTFLGGLLGQSSMTLSGQSGVSSSLGSYVDVQVAVDHSSSMTIAAVATPGDTSQINAMLAATAYPTRLQNFSGQYFAWGWGGNGGCAFACHWDNTSSPPNDFYQASRTLGIRLRLDQMTDATNLVYSQMASLPTVAYYRFGLYQFATSVSQLQALQSLSNPAATPGNLITPTLANPNAPYETSVTQSVQQLAASYVTNAGNGTTQAKARKYVFLLTDGVDDVYCPGNCNNSSHRVESAMNPTACDALKTKGVQVAVIHTLFYNPNNEFQEITAIQPAVATALQACASSPGLYIQVADGASLTAAINYLTQTALGLPATFNR